MSSNEFRTVKEKGSISSVRLHVKREMFERVLGQESLIMGAVDQSQLDFMKKRTLIRMDRVTKFDKVRY